MTHHEHDDARNQLSEPPTGALSTRADFERTTPSSARIDDRFRLGLERAARAARKRASRARCPTYLAQGVAHLTDRDVVARASTMCGIRLSPSRSEASRSRRSASSTAAESRCRAQRLHALDLLLLERRVDAEDVELLSSVELVPVDADDHALPRLDLRLVAEGRFGDLALEEVLLDRRDDAAELADALGSSRRPRPRAGSSAPRRSRSRRAGRSC